MARQQHTREYGRWHQRCCFEASISPLDGTLKHLLGAGGAPPAAPRVPAAADDGRESERERSDRTIKGSAAARDLRTTQPPRGPLAAAAMLAASRLPSPNLDSPGWYPKPLHHYLFTQYQAAVLTHTAFNCNPWAARTSESCQEEHAPHTPNSGALPSSSRCVCARSHTHHGFYDFSLLNDVVFVAFTSRASQIMAACPKCPCCLLRSTTQRRAKFRNACRAAVPLSWWPLGCSACSTLAAGVHLSQPPNLTHLSRSLTVVSCFTLPAATKSIFLFVCRRAA